MMARDLRVTNALTGEDLAVEQEAHTLLVHCPLSDYGLAILSVQLAGESEEP
ncbi:MAG: hypothetical protein U9R79_17100 [Armatimonadota bacterium]|nr:hypothetical protein [Armatimonadota bacterium]